MGENNNKGVKIKPLEKEITEFTANGKKYFFEPQPSPLRYEEMQVKQIEISYGMTMLEYHKHNQKAIELCNKAEFVPLAVHLYNLEKATQHIGRDIKQNPILRYCCLFINREDEDRRGIDEKFFDEKIQDWLDEGISMYSFLEIALGTSSELRAISSRITRQFSEQMQKAEKSPKKK